MIEIEIFNGPRKGSKDPFFTHDSARLSVMNFTLQEVLHAMQEREWEVEVGQTFIAYHRAGISYKKAIVFKITSMGLGGILVG